MELRVRYNERINVCFSDAQYPKGLRIVMHSTQAEPCFLHTLSDLTATCHEGLWPLVESSKAHFGLLFASVYSKNLDPLKLDRQAHLQNSLGRLD